MFIIRNSLWIKLKYSRENWDLVSIARFFYIKVLLS